MKRGNLTRLRILVEFAKNQPRVRQSDVAKAIDISPQAVSRHVSALEDEGLLASDGRSQYRVTQEGVDWMSRRARELKGYADSVLTRVIGGERLWTAVADTDLEKGDEIYLEIRDGVLHATWNETPARGLVANDAAKGQDVGIEHTGGIVEMHEGHVEIRVIPDISEGGSRTYDDAIPDGTVGVVGTEALVTLRDAGREPDMYFAAAASAASAAIHGIDVTLLVSRSRLPGVLRTMEDEEVDFDVVD